MKREEQLQRTLWEIDKKWGQGTIRTAADAAPRRSVSTGFDAVDHALHAGGMAAQQITVIMGIPTSGATTCVYRAISRVQKTAGIAAYIDFSATFDPDVAARCAITLSHLLLVRTESIDDGLQVARDIVLTNAVALLIIDLCECTVTLSKQVCERLADVTLRSECAVMTLIDRYDASLQSVAHTWLTFERQMWLKQGDRVSGCRTHVVVRKDKPNVKFAVVPLDIPFETME